MIDVQKLRDLAERAVGGPWNHSRVVSVDTALGTPIAITVPRQHDGEAAANGAYIAAANPQAVLALLDEVERLRDYLIQIGSMEGEFGITDQSFAERTIDICRAALQRQPEGK